MCGMCRAAVAFGNRMWGNEVVMNYLRTGEYRHWAPIAKVTRWTARPAPKLCLITIIRSMHTC